MNGLTNNKSKTNEIFMIETIISNLQKITCPTIKNLNEILKIFNYKLVSLDENMISKFLESNKEKLLKLQVNYIDEIKNLKYDAFKLSPEEKNLLLLNNIIYYYQFEEEFLLSKQYQNKIIDVIYQITSLPNIGIAIFPVFHQLDKIYTVGELMFKSIDSMLYYLNNSKDNIIIYQFYLKENNDISLRFIKDDNSLRFIKDISPSDISYNTDQINNNQFNNENKEKEEIITGFGKELIITEFSNVTKEGVVLHLNKKAKLKTGNLSSYEFWVSWDKIGEALFQDYHKCNKT